jgi:PGF-pre-PGF domain-containing protein
MERHRGFAAVILCVLLLCTAALAMSSPVVANDEYEITVPGSVDTPTRDVEIQGETYEISSIAKAEINTSVDVEVTAPDADSEYRLYLYNSDNQVVTTPGDGAGSPLYSGDTTATFDLTGIESGTYAFGVQEGSGAPDAIHPLVIEAFDTSIASAPGSATVGDDITVDVEVTRDSEADAGVTKDRVEVVIASDSQNITTTAEEDGGDYTATIDTSSLSAGSYDVYATVRGTEEVLGEDEVLGISDDQSLRLDAPDDESTESPDGGGGGGGAGAPAPGAGTATPSGTATPEDSATSTNGSTDLGIDDVSGTQVVSQTRANITMDADSSTAVATFDSSVSVSRVEFGSGSNASSGSVQVTDVSTAPAETGSPPGAATAVTDIQVPTEIADQPATIQVRIPADRLETTGATAEEIRVYRYADDDWQPLDTRVVGESNATVTVAAETPGFSFFSARAVGSPTAEMTVAPETAAAGTELTLNGSASTDTYGRIVAYKWIIGDQTLTSETTTAVIEEPGEYTVELTVTNDANETDTVTKTVRIEQTATDSSQSQSMPTERTTETPASNVISPSTEESQESSGFAPLPMYVVFVGLLLGVGFVAYRRRNT